MRPLPIGIDDFKKLRENNFCYVDKSLFIQELLDNRSEVSVFMRPRRFGKTLGLSMLKYYFEKEFDPDGNEVNNKKSFDGLNILDTGEKYTKYMGAIPGYQFVIKMCETTGFPNSL